MSQVESPARAGLTAGQGIGTAAALLMAGTILSRVLGLAREQVTAYMFGTGDRVAAFTIADNIHTMLFDLVISGMMQAALIPVLSEYAGEERRDELRSITGTLLTISALGIGAVVVLLEIFAPAAVAVMTELGATEQARSQEVVDLTVEMVRLILPAVWLLSISTILMATLYALQRFTRPALSLSVRNAAIVFAALTLGRTTLGVRSLVVGIVLGALLLVAIQLPGLKDAMPRPNFNLRHPAIKRIYLLYLPIFVGLFANTFALIVDRNLAWRVGEDALGAMRFATTLNQMILGLVAAAISLAALPALSRHFSAGDEDAYRATLARGLRMVTVLVIPAALGMAALSWPVVRLIFFHGETSREGAELIWLALLLYLPGTLFAAFDQVLIFAFYARQNTKLPQIVGVLAVGVYFVFALSLYRPLGMAGLVLANSAQFTFHALVMIWLLRRLLAGERLDDGRFARTLKVCLGVGLLMSAAAGLLALGLSLGLPEAGRGLAGLLRDLVIVAIPVAAGAAIYAAGLFRFDIEEAALIRRRVLALVGR
ncbi:MAG TPA: murein biosynthesis integral membrane protein MurJ [Thermomicrobiales bacterium]|nr:murein biosynthesis integral membrane protein MurJ [Thermomicrobiales bacterium]